MMGLLGLILAGFACADSTFDDDGEGGFRLTPEAESTMPLPSLDALPPGVPIVYAGIFVDKVYELSLVSRTISRGQREGPAVLDGGTILILG